MSRGPRRLYPALPSSQSKLPNHLVVSTPLAYSGAQITTSLGDCGIREAIDDLHDFEV